MGEELADERFWGRSADRPARAPGFAQRALLLSLAADLDKQEDRDRLYAQVVQRRGTADYYLCLWDPDREQKEKLEAEAYNKVGQQPVARPALDLALPRSVPFMRAPVVYRKASEIWRTAEEFAVGFGPQLRQLREAVTVLDDEDSDAALLRRVVDRVRGWLTQSFPHLNQRLEFGAAAHLNLLAAAYYGLAARQLTTGRWLECLECGAIVPRTSRKQVFCRDACRKRFARREEQSA